MKYIVYILQADDGRLYKGMTNNLARRLAEHRRGKTKTTRNMKNIRIVYTEEYTNRADARKREKYFKSATGRRFLKRTLGA